MTELARYAGGKNGAGIFQKIINVIPPHHTYVEAFAGSAAIYRRKAPAASSILIELDPQQAKRLEVLAGPACDVVCTDAVDWLDALAQREREPNALSGWFVYLDPPYLPSTRNDLKLYGDFELDEDEHDWLLIALNVLTKRGAKWALSGYRSDMYDRAAEKHGWHRLDYTAQTRRGPVTESLWTNYSTQDLVPSELTYLGGNFRERERLKRKRARWVAKLKALPRLEREFLMEALASIAKGDEGTRPPGMADLFEDTASTIGDVDDERRRESPKPAVAAAAPRTGKWETDHHGRPVYVDPNWPFPKRPD